MSNCKRVELSVRTSTCNQITIEPSDGFTAEQILEMLNKGEASFRPGNSEIVRRAPPPLEGGTVLARVVRHRVGNAETRWEVVPDADGDRGAE